MFKCERCHRITKPGEKMSKMPIRFRDKIYQYEKKYKNKSQIITSYGKEIEKEISICERCERNNEKISRCKNHY